MRWLLTVRERISAIWFVLKLSVLLGQFLVWFGVNQYLLGRVFLVSFCWFTLGLVLLANQVLVPKPPIITTPDLENLTLSSTQHENLIWKLVSQSELTETCTTLNEASLKHPTHQSLLRNKALCLLTQNDATTAQNIWKQALGLNPNK